MKHEIVLTLCFWGFEDITHEEISHELQVEPTKVQIKGKRKNPAFLPLAKENGWLLEISSNHFVLFEKQLNSLLDFVSTKKEKIKELSNKYTCEISCALYLRYGNEESIPSIHLGERYHSVFKDVNVQFDLDIFCLPNK